MTLTASRFGRWLLGAAMVALGLQSLLLTNYVMRLEPMPDSVAGHALLANASGAYLLVCGGCILRGWHTRIAAAALAVLLLLWTLVLYLPPLIAKPSDGTLQAGTFEDFALFGAAWLLAATSPAAEVSRLWDALIDRGVLFGRICFGISLPIFGLTHFEFHDFVAQFIPQWIPARQFWAYFTGVAHIAAGLAILSGVQARLAATLLGTMFGLWVVLLHIPRVIAAPHDAFEWNGIFVASALCGGAWIVAGSNSER